MTFRLQDRKTISLHFHYLIPVIPKTWQGTKGFQRRMINIRTAKTHMFKVDEMECDSELSRREVEILGLLGKGFISKEIADRLYISVNTVNNHRQNIIRKMGLSNTYEAITYAQKLGIV